MDRRNELVISRSVYPHSYSLSLDKTKCSGCGICVKVCPRDAIDFKPVSLLDNKENISSFIDIDENKCQYCRICTKHCPFGAFNTLLRTTNVIHS